MTECEDYVKIKLLVVKEQFFFGGELNDYRF